ncbi:OLC1v1036173C1, partial [Oldenlandia corymbosa var. corymbosa]
MARDIIFESTSIMETYSIEESMEVATRSNVTQENGVVNMEVDTSGLLTSAVEETLENTL